MGMIISGLAKLELEAMRIQEESGLSLDEAREVAKTIISNKLISGTTGADAMPAKKTDIATITRNKLRKDSLDAPIEKAIKQAGCLDTAAVLKQLKELALSGDALPFTGAFEGSALCYTNDRDEPALLTKNALDKRLSKRRKASA